MPKNEKLIAFYQISRKVDKIKCLYFYRFDAYLTPFWVPAFATLANLEMHFFQKDLVEPISKWPKFKLS